MPHTFERWRWVVKTNPNLVGACFPVHGRLELANGNPGWRIWVVGTKRVLGVFPDDPYPPSPACLLPHVGDGKRLYADFLVCPFASDRRGSMRPVCIESASHRVVETGPPARVEKLDGVCAAR
jgi:hypothetical protein